MPIKWLQIKMFADDIVLLADLEKVLQDYINKCDRLYENLPVTHLVVIREMPV